jgi:transposase
MHVRCKLESVCEVTTLKRMRLAQAGGVCRQPQEMEVDVMTHLEASARFIGLDVHKNFLVATGVDRDQNQVYGPIRVPIGRLETWIEKDLAADDAVVLEMTTNTWTVADALEAHVLSVTVVHPPHVALITRAQVMTDRKAALTLAQLHAAGLLPAVWVPPPEVRDLRALVAQRHKMVRLSTQAKNRLQSLLHRHRIQVPEDMDLYAEETRSWWEELPLSAMERVRMQCNLDTLTFAAEQRQRLEACLSGLAALDPQVPLLIQLPGVGLIVAMTVLGAVGDISRFPSAEKLVGYSGLGARVHDSGETRRTGRITKAGRRDLRHVMIQAAHSAARTHPHWKAEMRRLEPRLGSKKAIVAIARKLLVAVWHVLTENVADRYAVDLKVAHAFFAFAYKVGVRNLPDGLSAKAFVRQQLDRLVLGQELTEFRWGGKTVRLPPSSLAA